MDQRLHIHGHGGKNASDKVFPLWKVKKVLIDVLVFPDSLCVTPLCLQPRDGLLYVILEELAEIAHVDIEPFAIDILHFFASKKYTSHVLPFPRIPRMTYSFGFSLNFSVSIAVLDPFYLSNAQK